MKLPMYLAFIATSIGLLTACSASDVVKQEVDNKVGEAKKQVKERVEVKREEVKERVQERAGEVKEQVQERVEKRANQVRERVSENAQERIGNIRENIQQRRQSRVGGRLRDRLAGPSQTSPLLSPNSRNTESTGQNQYGSDFNSEGEFSDSKETIYQLRRRRGRIIDRLRNR